MSVQMFSSHLTHYLPTLFDFNFLAVSVSQLLAEFHVYADQLLPLLHILSLLLHCLQLKVAPPLLQLVVLFYKEILVYRSF